MVRSVYIYLKENSWYPLSCVAVQHSASHRYRKDHWIKWKCSSIMENIKFIHPGHSSNECDPVTALLLIKVFHVLDVNFVQVIEINEKSSSIQTLFNFIQRKRNNAWHNNAYSSTAKMYFVLIAGHINTLQELQ